MLVLMLLGTASRGVRAQPAADGTQLSSAMSYAIPRDRRTLILLLQARELLRAPEGDSRQAIQLLQRIVDESEDFFTVTSLSSSVRSEADQMLSTLRGAAQNEYEQTFGPEARTLWEAARAERNMEGMREVARRFFYTAAGAQAGQTLAAAALDCGEMLSAARWYERLRFHPGATVSLQSEFAARAVLGYWHAGWREAAASALMDARARLPQGVRINGQTPPSTLTVAELPNWLEQVLGTPRGSGGLPGEDWLMSGGAVHRNATVGTVNPLFDEAWTFPLIDVADVTGRHAGSLATQAGPIIENLRTLAASVEERPQLDKEWRALPVPSPIIVGDTVVLPTYSRLKAVDVRTGRLRWASAEFDPEFRRLIASLSASVAGNRAVASEMQDLMTERAFLDRTAAGLSSDGERVYAVFHGGRREGVVPPTAQEPPFNQLRAYDIATEGKLVWELGGPQNRIPPPVAGTFFLGAPVPVAGTLYVMGDDRGQVRLLALDPATGDVRWSMPLVNTLSDPTLDVERRVAGLTPSALGDLLVCAPGDGFVSVVDVATRSLVWGTFYREPAPAEVRQPVVRGFLPGAFPFDQTPSTEELLSTRGWLESSPLLSGEVVVLAPADDERLLCFSLRDGTRRWERPRNHWQYPAAVHGGHVVVVGERTVDGVSLEDGRTVWSLPVPPASGRGVRSGERFHLPLADGTLMTIDLNEGRLLARSQTRSGATLGNLVAVSGRLVTLTTTQCRGFRSWDDVTRQIESDLAADPEDPAPLAVRGELRLHAGDAAGGLDDLRRALARGDDPAIRELLVDVLLERLGRDFAANADSIGEIERLELSSRQRVRLLRLAAMGYEQQGELSRALESYVGLLNEEGLRESTEYVDLNRSVRTDRWMQGQFERLYERATPAQRSELDERLAMAAEDLPEDLATRRRFAQIFRRAAAADDVRASIRHRADEVEDPLRREALLLARRARGTTADRMAAVLELLEFYADHECGEPVAALLDELQEVYGHTESADGETGQAIAARWRGDDRIRQLLPSPVFWPTGQVSVLKSTGNTSQRHQNPLSRMGPVDSLNGQGCVLSDLRGNISFLDGYGRELSTVQLGLVPQVGFPQTHYLERRGHRALVFLGNQFALLDLLDPRRPRVIHADLLTGRSADTRDIQAGKAFRGWLRFEQFSKQFVGNVGPLQDELFCYLREDTLFALDPFDGQELWRLEGVPHGSEIFADGDYVVLVPPRISSPATMAHVLRAADGESLGVRTLPPAVVRDRRNADWGRHFLTQQRDSSGLELGMYDPVHEETVWSRRFDADALWAPLDGFELVVLAPDGTLNRLDPLTGEVLLSMQVDVPDDLLSIVAVGLAEEWVLFTQRVQPTADQAEQPIPPRSTTREVHQVNGDVHAFDRHTGEKRWSRVVQSQMVELNLPGRWPVIPLACKVQTTRRFGGNAVAFPFQKLMLLDRRSGDVLYEGDGEAEWYGLHWQVDDGRPRLVLWFGASILEVTLGGKTPRPLGADSQADPEQRTPLPAPPDARQGASAEPERSPPRRPPPPPPPADLVPELPPRVPDKRPPGVPGIDREQ
jgi:outer membrane protein assembly factor BamB